MSVDLTVFRILNAKQLERRSAYETAYEIAKSRRADRTNLPVITS